MTARPRLVANEFGVSAECGQISHHKVPRYWKFVEGFPKTVTGKVQKFTMREMPTEELGLATVDG
jgi:fatty-acyl-CoA synthase